MPMLYLLIALLFLGFIVVPEVGIVTTLLGEEVGVMVDPWRQPIYGLIHIPSIGFIGGAAFLLLSSTTAHWYRKTSGEGKVEEEFAKANRLMNDLVALTPDDPQIYRGLHEARTKCSLVGELDKLFRHGAMEQDIDLLLAKHADRRVYMLRGRYQELGYVGGLLPLLGMIGTIAGLMFMFTNPDSLDDFAQKFSGLATALMTTLYATLITALVVKPRQKHLARDIHRLEHEAEMLAHNACLLYHMLDLPLYRHFVETGELPGLTTDQNDEAARAA